MDKTQIILFSVAMAFLAVRLYQKYIKKNQANQGGERNPSSSTSFPSSVKDDEYEPYSKK
jgi:uncharacterized membrane protein YebE (DUF533 family)